ncbi:MAG: sigma-54 dependent transcriptional regulator [Gemmatimonadota bacterium]|jgi:DNA-binding NtrC family response regulator
MKGRILVVDDHRAVRESLAHHLRRDGYEAEEAAGTDEALALVGKWEPDIVLTDIRMPGRDGLELLIELQEILPETDVIMMTAHEDMRTAVSAMKEGAYEYLVKPLDLEELEILIERCLRDRILGRRLEGASVPEEDDGLNQMVGEDPKMIEIYKLMGRLSRNRATVLIRGETGTGKERIARAIHAESPAASEPFLALNCTAVSETLLESELFGHVRGAFTGASNSRRGFFEMAGRGTVFLDEIGDTSLAFQAKLLRVLEDGEFYPVGAEKPRRTEARIMAATHRPLEKRVEEGTFREDLYFRLRVVEIEVPPLRDRPGDIPLLAHALLKKVSGALHLPLEGFLPGTLDRLKAYDWPGNVRELENVLTRAAVLTRGSLIHPETVILGKGGAAASDIGASTGPTLDYVEAAHVQETLNRAGGNKRKTARALGISRPRLDRLIDRHGLILPEKG